MRVAAPLAACAAALGVSVLLTATAPQAALAQQMTTLYEGYVGYPPCYRQPVLVILSPSNMIAFVEGRNITGPGTMCSGLGDGDNSSIRLRTTSDGGQTWGPQQELFHGHPDYLSAVYDAIKGRVHLFIMNSPNLWTYSDDAGSTWSPLTQPKVTLPAGVTGQPGVAHGIQLVPGLCPEPTCGGAAGRLIVAWVCHHGKVEEEDEAAAGGAAPRSRSSRSSLRAWAKATASGNHGLADVACPGCYSCLAYSDDHGDSWTVQEGGMSNQDGSREASVVQLQSSAVPGATGAVVYATERNMGNSTGHRLHAVSTDGGETFSSFGADPGIPDSVTANWTGIVAGATRFDTSAGRRIVISTTFDKTARADLALFSSQDEAGTWSSGKIYRPGPAGYSDAGQVNATHGAVLFENGDTEFAQRVSFGWFTVADL
jgi:sialidase-1